MAQLFPSESRSLRPEMTAVMRSEVSLLDYKDGRPYIRLEEPWPEVKAPLPLLRREVEFEPLLMKRIFFKLQEHQSGSSVPGCLFRKAMRRLMDMFTPEVEYRLEDFGWGPEMRVMDWPSVVRAAVENRIPKVPMTPPQQLFVVLNDDTSSKLARLWFYVTILAIFANTYTIIIKTMPDAPKDEMWFHLMETVPLWMFTFDYFAKLFMSPWCPIAIMNSNWILAQIVPQTNQLDKMSDYSVQSTQWERFLYFLSTPAHLIDLISITPFLFSKVPLPLQCFRMLRLLRFMRILRAFKFAGGLVKELQILGEAFYNSVGAIAVIVLYILIFAMVVGAILHREENANPDASDAFKDVPTSVWYAIAQLVGNQAALPYGRVIASTPLSIAVICAMGLFKEIIFLLPIEQLKKATMRYEKAMLELQHLSCEVDDELSKARLPKEVLFASDYSSPFVRLELAPAGGGESAFGTISVPILMAHPVEVVVHVPLQGAGLVAWCGPSPGLEAVIVWKPDAEMGKTPMGVLSIEILRGVNFASSCRSPAWTCKLQAPTCLYDTGGGKSSWSSPLSSSGEGGCPTWTGATGSFEIRWKAEPVQDEKVQHHDATFHKRILELLDTQAKSLEAMEKHKAMDQSKTT
eukprot:TRINITY_DN2022_c0_g1_i1.p1 TRINITY_DN2022_c0_g1~~TRINITY_DN2022_c0_g1_i1.p1  ORF type:complete len:633 (-),score=150.52 TRINITY_DN2022_c0_g1_i1:144-2042(-)